MSQQELPIDGIKTGSGHRGSSSRTRTSSELLLEQQTRRHIPLFEPIDAEDARARAAVEQWRTFTMLLEPQVGAVVACFACFGCIQNGAVAATISRLLRLEYESFEEHVYSCTVYSSACLLYGIVHTHVKNI